MRQLSGRSPPPRPAPRRAPRPRRPGAAAAWPPPRARPRPAAHGGRQGSGRAEEAFIDNGTMRRLPRFASLTAALALLAASHAFAQRLPGDVTPSHYDLSFDVDLANARFTGTETIRVDLA